MTRARALVANAVVGKELRTRMRSWRTAVILTFYMATLGAISVAFLVRQSGLAINQSSEVGLQLFVLLSVFQLCLIVFVTPASTAGAISGERQRQTWDLLLVTRLSSFGIAWGKLVTGLAFNLILILASMPLFSLVFLFGGVAPDDVLHTYIVFLATIVLLGAACLFVSALTRRLVASMVIGNLVALGLTLGLGLLTVYLETTGQRAVGTALYVSPPPLTPLAELDPFIALFAALPSGSGGPVLGDLGLVHHAFGLPWDMQLWAAFAWLALAISVLLFLLTALLVRSEPPWLGWEAS